MLFYFQHSLSSLASFFLARNFHDIQRGDVMGDEIRLDVYFVFRIILIISRIPSLSSQYWNEMISSLTRFFFFRLYCCVLSYKIQNIQFMECFSRCFFRREWKNVIPITDWQSRRPWLREWTRIYKKKIVMRRQRRNEVGRHKKLLTQPRDWLLTFSSLSVVLSLRFFYRQQPTTNEFKPSIYLPTFSLPDDKKTTTHPTTKLTETFWLDIIVLILW